MLAQGGRNVKEYEIEIEGGGVVSYKLIPPRLCLTNLIIPSESHNYPVSRTTRFTVVPNLIFQIDLIDMSKFKVEMKAIIGLQ